MNNVEIITSLQKRMFIRGTNRRNIHEAEGKYNKTQGKRKRNA